MYISKDQKAYMARSCKVGAGKVNLVQCSFCVLIVWNWKPNFTWFFLQFFVPQKSFLWSKSQVDKVDKPHNTKHINPSFNTLHLSPSLRFGACPLEPAFGQVHTSLAWASLYPIDWGWVCHCIRIKVLRLSIKWGPGNEGGGLVKDLFAVRGLLEKVSLQNSKKKKCSSCSNVTSRSNLSTATVIMKIGLLINH